MKLPKMLMVLAAIAIAAMFALQRTGSAQATTNLRITAPENGHKFSSNIVQLRYELINPSVSASSSPTYELQLDSTAPVQTTSTDYTFTGLQPGQHTVVIKLVDANGTPVAGAVNAVKFIVLPPEAAPRGVNLGVEPGGREAKVQAAVLSAQNGPASSGGSLPETGGALPLLSIIGFGVLLGGIASALKTR